MDSLWKKYDNEDGTYLYELPNGLRIVFTPTAKSGIVYCGFLIGTGSRYESEKDNGMAHFIEHSLFKGTQKRSSGKILTRLESVGGELNAFTMREKTCFYAISLKQYFERAVDLLTDLVFNPLFPEEELEKEKKVIIEEIEMYEDNPEETIYDEFTGLLFNNHPLGHNILGKIETVSNFRRDDVVNFWKSFYYPGNMIFSVVGSISFRKLENIINKYLLILKDASPENEFVSVGKYEPFRHTKDKDYQQVQVILGNRAYPLKEKKRIVLSLINNILGGDWMSSRLNVILREKHAFAYNISSGYNAYLDSGSFTIQYGTDIQYLDKSISLVSKELKKLRENKLSSFELNRAKRQMLSQYAMYRENYGLVMQNQARNLMDFGYVLSKHEYFKMVNHIDAMAVLETVNEVMDEKEMSLLIYKNRQKLSSEIKK